MLSTLLGLPAHLPGRPPACQAQALPLEPLARANSYGLCACLPCMLYCANLSRQPPPPPGRMQARLYDRAALCVHGNQADTNYPTTAELWAELGPQVCFVHMFTVFFFLLFW